MAFKDTWVNKTDNIDVVEASDINSIANELIRLGEQGGGGSTDLNNYYTKKEVDEKIGDIGIALDELHIYAQTLVNGGV